QRFRLESLAGIVEAVEHDDGRISVDMGQPRFAWNEIPLSHEVVDTSELELHAGRADSPVLHSPSAVSMGNPHVIFWVEGDVWSYALERFGPELETHPLFPERCNISIAHVEDTSRITLRTWERGA